MTAEVFIADLLALSAQIGCVIAVASVLPLVVRIDAASVRYHYWRALLVLCALLPWLQRRQAATPAFDVMNTVTFPAVAVWSSSAAVSPAPSGIPWLQIAVWMAIGGVGLRLSRMGLGLIRLRRLRRSGRAALPNAEHDDLQWALGTRAEIRYVCEGQPVTCGAWRPIVLLPESLLAHPPEIQRAVLVHELLHVQRRDWLWVMGEELLRAVLWFHPGVWWLVSRVRLAREEVVDELTVLATGQRRAYLEALLAFADAAPLVPSAAFARRTHLFRRMMLISKEAVMSSKRVVFSCAVLALAVIAGSWYAVGAFPMMQAPGAVQPAAQTGAANEPGPLERRAKPITPENPIPRRTYSVTPQNPGGSNAGVVMLTLRVTLDAQGRVGEVRSVGVGPGRAVFTMSDGAGDNVVFAAPQAVGRGGAPFGAAGGFAPPPETFVKAAIDAVRQWLYDPPAEAPISFDVSFAFAPGQETRLISHGGPAAVRFSPPPPPPPPPPGSGPSSFVAAQGAVRVGGNVRPPTKVKNVPPDYPEVAKTAGVQGVVIIEALIGKEGRVEEAHVLRSIPLLDQAALDAVTQWEFTPTLLNGQPVPVIMTMTVQFTLN